MSESSVCFDAHIGVRSERSDGDEDASLEGNTRRGYVRRGVEPEGTERVRVSGRDATLVVWSPDYDGKGKACVRFDDGTDAIVGGSRVER